MFIESLPPQVRTKLEQIETMSRIRKEQLDLDLVITGEFQSEFHPAQAAITL